MPSIGSLCVISFSLKHVFKTALLKSDISLHFKAYSSHSFQLTGNGLGSLWRGNWCVCPLSRNTYKFVKKKRYKFLKLFILPKKYAHFKKIQWIYYSLKKNNNWVYFYIYQYIDNFKFLISKILWGVRVKVFYGQVPPSGESTTTECGFNYQLLAVIYWTSPMGNS